MSPLSSAAARPWAARQEVAGFKSLTSPPAPHSSWASLTAPHPLPAEFSISSFCSVVDVVNFSKLQVLRLDGNEIGRSAMPADAPLCLRLASLIEI